MLCASCRRRRSYYLVYLLKKPNVESVISVFCVVYSLCVSPPTRLCVLMLHKHAASHPASKGAILSPLSRFAARLFSRMKLPYQDCVARNEVFVILPEVMRHSLFLL
jgi:hypothetical protein